MEWQLYGGANYGTSAPSFGNGFRGAVMGTAMMSPYMTSAAMYPYGIYNNTSSALMNPYGMYNNMANPSSSSLVDNYTKQQDTAKTSSVGESDLDTLANFYKKGLEPSEGLMGSVIGGAAFGLINNPRLIVHPWNSIKGVSDVKNMFKGVREEGSAMNALWKENEGVMREAYFQMHKASSRATGWKAGLFRKRYDADLYKTLKGEMQRALNTGNVEEIAKASETLKAAYVNDGALPKAWRSVKGFLGFKSEAPDIAARIADKTTIAENATKLISESNTKSFTKALKHCGGGLKGALFFMGVELVMGIGKITTAYGKDSKTGNEQLKQTLIKGAGSAAGWAAGEAAGVWAMGALGAKIGTLFGPGVGTAIGGLVGVIGGSIGCWLAGKATHAIVGQDVADSVKAKNLTKTAEGQAQLLQYTLDKYQSGDKLDPKIINAANNVYAKLA
jgi:hypothetical protein